MYETPSLHKFGYSSEQLKLREYQELKDMIKSQEKLAQITHSKLKDDLQRDFENDIENQVEEKIKANKISSNPAAKTPTEGIVTSNTWHGT